MPEIFWNSGEGEKMEGLDVMGYRRWDQGVEYNWVGGVTTISFRARYLSMLPWFLQEFFERHLKGESTGAFQKTEFEECLRRFELVVFLASLRGGVWGESGNTFGVLGKDLFADHAAALERAGSTDSRVAKGGSSLGTYLMPGVALGLLDLPTPGSGLPVAIPSRGRELYEARRKQLVGSRLCDVIFSGGAIDRADVDGEGRSFSINGIESISEEAAIVRAALLEPAPGRERSSFERLQSTIEWSFRGMAGSEDVSADELIRGAFAHVVLYPEAAHDAVALAWFEYEARRRVHFAAELLLDAVTRYVRAAGRAAIDDVVVAWIAAEDVPPWVEARFGLAEAEFEESSARFVAQISREEYLHSGLPTAAVRQLDVAARARFAFGLLLCCVRQCDEIFGSGRIQGDPSLPLERAIDLAAREGGSSLAELLAAILREWVVAPHLNNALRKMAADAKGRCTLRFYPDGNWLRPTGLAVKPGMSGSRLSNVLGLLSDVGLADRVGNTRYRTNDLGRALLASRAASA